jgi:predicted metal-dependent peptidase
MNKINNQNDIIDKLAAARTQLILDKPFLGALVLRLPLKIGGQWCDSVATDAKYIYYNTDYVANLNLSQLQFVLAHEALHCALSHFARREHRNKQRWDLACDHAINPLLYDDGLAVPPGVWIENSFRGMTAEEIYPFIQDNQEDDKQEQNSFDQHVYDSQQGQDKTNSNQPPPLSDSEKQQLDIQWRQRLAGAAQQALQAGKLSADMARLVDHLLQPNLPWRALLAHYMSLTARDDYTYYRPSRREGNAIFPSLRSAQLEVIVAIDTSGSVGEDEINQFLSEINNLKGQLRAKITLLACDVQLTSVWQFEPWEEFKLPHSIIGGGGTDFRPVFAYLAEQDWQTDLLIYFTDAKGNFPSMAPDYPVLWLVKGKQPVPWGQRIQLN